ncbi:MAG: hypothetical protein KBC08_03860 [Caldisericia bacterium]|nr:hypothetical protein [Caldisericia bacterium]
MRKIICFMLLVAVAAGCGAKVPTWDEINAMVDGGEYKSKVDEAIKQAGPENHPASKVVLSYFENLFSGKYDEAWSQIEKNSPFQTARVSKKQMVEMFEKAKAEVDYKSARVISLSVMKKNANVRMVKVGFMLYVYDKLKKQDDTPIGSYTLSDLTGEWKIFDSEIK